MSEDPGMCTPVLDQTAELRRALKRRGIEYVKDDCGMRLVINETLWEAQPGGPYHKFVEYSHGQTRLSAINVTAERAIAATIGEEERPSDQSSKE